jgi:hypothetical protein
MNFLKERSVKVRRTLASWIRVEGSGFVLSIVGTVILLLVVRVVIFAMSGW